MEVKPKVPSPKANYSRRAVGVLICFSPIALVIASLCVSQICPRQSNLGVALSTCGLPVAGVNLYLAMVRPLMYRLRLKSMDGFRNISGLPAIGTLFVVFGSVVGFGDWRSAAGDARSCFGFVWIALVPDRDLAR